MNILLIRLPLTTIILVIGLACVGQTKVMLCTGKTSHSYHKERCQGLKQCKASIIFVTIEDAIKGNHDPCDFCYGRNPGDQNPARMSFKPKEAGSKPTGSATAQCMATTKKGTRCSRASSSNSYCWQHQKG